MLMLLTSFHQQWYTTECTNPLHSHSLANFVANFGTSEIILTTPTSHICRICPPKYAIQWGSVWHKSRLKSSDFNRKYGTRTQNYGIRTPRLCHMSRFWGGGGGLQFVELPFARNFCGEDDIFAVSCAKPLSERPRRLLLFLVPSEFVFAFAAVSLRPRCTQVRPV